MNLLYTLAAFVVAVSAACSQDANMASPQASQPDGAAAAEVTPSQDPPRPHRAFPDTSATIAILADQLPGGLTAAQQRVVADRFVGTQKLTLDLSRPLRALKPSFLVLHYHLAIWQSAPGVSFIVDGGTWGNDYREVDKHEAWFWHNANGQRVASSVDKKLLMNVGDAAFTKYWGDSIVEQVLEIIKPGERVLAIIPDKTRDDNTDVLFPITSRILDQHSVACFDALVAQGTHPPMSAEQKLLKLGLDQFTGTVFDHRWDRPEDLITLGELTADQVTDLTAGLITKAVPVTLNKLLAPGIYDTVLVFGATVPHEVAGFAGGAKYFFPGVAGPELTHMTHWLGALAGIETIIGEVETPTRRLIEAVACLSRDHDRLLRSAAALP